MWMCVGCMYAYICLVYASSIHLYLNHHNYDPFHPTPFIGLNAKGDHDGKKTYDDYNEFFWASSCLKYRIIDHQLLISDDIEYASATTASRQTSAGGGGYFKQNIGSGNMPLDESKLQHIAVGM